MDTNLIRNFSIVAHIDHGKSTLADRIMQLTGAVSEREMQEQLLDSMDLERERGITIKASAVSMNYKHSDGKTYLLNLIDTPGHVDFHYEVSRSLAACEGALLVVDSTQGVEAQTVANAYLAINGGLEIVPVINKIDLPSAQVDVVADEIEQVLGIKKGECIPVSAKSAANMAELLEAIVMLLPAPENHENEPLKALIFDSHYDDYRGVICYVRIVAGKLKKGDNIKMMAKGRSYQVCELGKFTPRMTRIDEIGCGEVGYMVAAIKDLSEVTVGDTITHTLHPCAKPLPGYQKPMQMVFSDFYPGNNTDYSRLRSAFDRLSLNDSSFSYVPQNSPALGFGFRCGFLGLLHMEIIQERLERENDVEVVQTAPTVSYEIVTTDDITERIDSPCQMPDPTKIKCLREPFVKLEVITPVDTIGPIMKLADERRCILHNQTYIGQSRVMLDFKAPLAEIVYDFYDLIKGVSRGYATMNYELLDFEESDLVRVNFLVNGLAVDALSIIIHRLNAETRARKLLLKLREAIPRHQFEVPLQATIGGKIIARETIKAFRKDVTAKLYGGDVTRKMKLLKKQKEGKARMKTIGSVNIPQEAFMSILDNSD